MESHNTSLTELQNHLSKTYAEKGWDKNSITEVFLLFSDLAEVYFEKHKINLLCYNKTT